MSLIQDKSVLLSRLRAIVSVTVRPTEDISAWTDLVLTLRLDPNWPRETHEDKAAARAGEMDLASWEEFGQFAGTIVSDGTGGEDAVIEFVIPHAQSISLEVGKNRGVLDCQRRESGSEVHVVLPTWFSVVDSLPD